MHMFTTTRWGITVDRQASHHLPSSLQDFPYKKVSIYTISVTTLPGLEPTKCIHAKRKNV